MIYYGTRDFYALFKMPFMPEDQVKGDIKNKGFPRYLPAFNKVKNSRVLVAYIVVYTLWYI